MMWLRLVMSWLLITVLGVVVKAEFGPRLNRLPAAVLRWGARRLSTDHTEQQRWIDEVTADLDLGVNAPLTRICRMAIAVMRSWIGLRRTKKRHLNSLWVWMAALSMFAGVLGAFVGVFIAGPVTVGVPLLTALSAGVSAAALVGVAVAVWLQRAVQRHNLAAVSIVGTSLEARWNVQAHDGQGR